jgi:hypothetical protein
MESIHAFRICHYLCNILSETKIKNIIKQLNINFKIECNPKNDNSYMNNVTSYLLNSIDSNDDSYIYLIFYYALYILQNSLSNLTCWKNNRVENIVEDNKFPIKFDINKLCWYIGCFCIYKSDHLLLFFDKLYDRYNKSYKNFEGLNNLFDECNNFIENYNYEIDKHSNIIKIDL